MGSLSDYAENELVDHVLNAAAPSPATVYLALATADPTDAGTGASMNEVANSNGYARTAITFAAPASRAIAQNADVDFPQATGSWGTVTHWAVVDSATHGAGNMLAHGAFTTSYPVVNGNSPTVASGEVTISVAASSGAGFVDGTVHGLLNQLFRNTAYGQPDTYIALSTTVLDDADSSQADFTEVTGTGYARKLVDQNGGVSPTWTVASGGAADNAAAVTWTVSGADWTQIVAAVLITTVSGAGTVLGYDNSNVTDQTPNNGDTVQFATGAFDVSMT